MTLDEVMRKYNGFWEDSKAIIQAEGGYYWIIAVGTPDAYTITNDGKRYVTTESEIKRGRKLRGDA